MTNFETFELLIKSPQSHEVRSNNIDVFEEAGYMVGTYGTINAFNNNKQKFVAIEDYGAYCHYKKNFGYGDG